MREVEESNNLVKFVEIDLFNVRTEEDFYRLLAEKTLQATVSKLQEAVSLLKNHLKHWIPRISFSPDQVQEISLGLNWQEVTRNPDEILDLPQRADRRGSVLAHSCSFHHGPDPLPLHHFLQVPRHIHVEDHDREFVLLAQGESSEVHHLQPFFNGFAE